MIDWIKENVVVTIVVCILLVIAGIGVNRVLDHLNNSRQRKRLR